jgi:hypothetical protein
VRAALAGAAGSPVLASQPLDASDHSDGPGKWRHRFAVYLSMGSGGCTSARRVPLGDDANPLVAAAVFAVEEKREISPPLSP